MAVPARYLEAAKIEELQQQLETEGYRTHREADGPGARFDLIAAKGDRTTAIAVKARALLGQQTDRIRSLRERAHEEGYDEFRLVIVNPPKEKTIEIPGLEEQLFSYLLNDLPMPTNLDRLASRVAIEGIDQLEINSIEVLAREIEISGVGLLDVALEWGGGEDKDGMTVYESFPFDFEATLDWDWKAREVRMNVDTSSYTEE